MNSRFFLVTVLGIALSAAAEPDRRPNVLWLIGDDHAAYVTGCYGNKTVRTPSLDRLASQGMRFDRAYCNSPVCTASRQSFQTGRYPTSVGVRTLKGAMPEAELTLADILQEAGYATAGFGKMHFNNLLNHGFEQRADLGEYGKAVRPRAKPVPQGLAVQPPWKPFRDPASVWLNSANLPVGLHEADMASHWFADRAIEFLQSPPDKPFFMMVSLPEPHSPFNYPVEFRGKYDPSQMPVGAKGPEDDGQVPDIFRELTHEQKQGIVAAYYTSTEFLDKQVGRVLEALEKSGQADNTLVIYIGDHGYSLGHHGRFEKHCMYEPAVRSPLIVRYPGKIKGEQATQALVEFVDIVPTVLEVCGVAKPQAVQGRSLLPVLRGQTDKHREQVFVEYAHNDEAMVFDGRWKLIYQRGQRVRDDGYDPKRPLPGPTFKLYDLESDPDEMLNVAGKPDNASRVQAMAKLMADHFRNIARDPGKVPQSDDPMVILDYCVQPQDGE